MSNSSNSPFMTSCANPGSIPVRDSKCVTFEDFRWLVNDDENLELAKLAFPRALEHVSTLKEAMELLWATESLDDDLQKLAFVKVMEYITDSESLSEFDSAFRPGWFGWLFSHREFAMLVCDKCEKFN